MFTALLIQRCDIQQKALSNSGYEKVASWNDIATDVPCRHDSDNGAKIKDTELRLNTDDDIFFFDPDVTIARDNRIVFEGLNYSVIKVNKLLDSTKVHHLEVVARLTDHK